MTPGRNDLCPCGSGKKYKHCCLRAAQAPEPPEELAWRRLRRLLDEHNREMLRFVSNVYGKQAFDEAWWYFVSDEEAEFDPESRDIQLFMPWFYHRWAPEQAKSSVRDTSLHGVIPTAEYLRRKRQLDPLLREYLESCLAAPFSAFEILQVEAGRRMLMKDLFTGAEHDVSERSASAIMDDGDLVIGQVARAGGVALLEATQGFVIPPICKIDVVEFRVRCFAGAIGISPERLRAAEDGLLTLYHEIAERLFSPTLPTLLNTDGDPVSLRRVVFDVPSAEEAFDALKHLALGESDENLLGEAEHNADGKLSHVRFPWLKRGNAERPEWDNTVLGSIEIEGERLFVEVNSEQREALLRDIVTKALGEHARYRATKIHSLEKLLDDESMPARAADDGGGLAHLPEVQAKMREVMANHYNQWLKDKIPALGNRTPLEAVKDPTGREAVEALLRQIERDGARMNPPLEPEIIRSLRERLNLP